VVICNTFKNVLSSIILDFPVILDNQFYTFNIIIMETINFKL
jgi:hypothetical protein